ncbi:hypothetical protein OESDEN_05797 [Oesophagostomum dentatum]|uniref:Uncharacterized protein n=1 Tax=Oesophagostomum dentatum TaxID=61180 RepID=A0A0B1TAJ1_OESDE|nr:hypothetical protein OESDEN_05797 [Oesophagostomum dentatum]
MRSSTCRESLWQCTDFASKLQNTTECDTAVRAFKHDMPIHIGLSQEWSSKQKLMVWLTFIELLVAFVCVGLAVIVPVKVRIRIMAKKTAAPKSAESLESPEKSKRADRQHRHRPSGPGSSESQEDGKPGRPSSPKDKLSGEVGRRPSAEAGRPSSGEPDPFDPYNPPKKDSAERERKPGSLETASQPGSAESPDKPEPFPAFPGGAGSAEPVGKAPANQDAGNFFDIPKAPGNQPNNANKNAQFKSLCLHLHEYIG